MRNAVEIVERTTSPYALFGGISPKNRAQFNMRELSISANVMRVSGLPPAVRLALEISLHEQSNRRALQGERKERERRWSEAEEIATISDGPFIPNWSTADHGKLWQSARIPVALPSPSD